MGLAVLRSNPVYRLHDLINQWGMRYRVDSMSILCESRYRDTFFRRVLQDTITFNGVPLLRNLTDSDVEAFVASVGDEGEAPGFYKLSGRGAGSFELATPGAAELSLATVLKEKKERGECTDLANDNELVVDVRVGDTLSNKSQILDEVSEYINASEGSIASVVVSAVLHYGNNTYKSSFKESAKHDDGSINLIKNIVADIEQQFGLPVRVRSEPVVDSDLCFYTHAKNLVGPLGRGMFRLVASVQRYL